MEFLKEFLGEELYGKVAEKLKGNDKVKLANLASGEHVSKGKFDDTVSNLNSVKQQLAERDGQLEELKKTVGLGEEFKAKITELENSNKSQKEEFEKRLSEQAFDFALTEALKGQNAKDIKSVLVHLDKSKLALDNEKIIGLDEQVKSLKEQNLGFLFGEEQPPAGIGGVPGATDDGNSANGFNFNFMGVRPQEKTN